MEITAINEAKKLVEKLADYEQRLENLRKTKGIDYIEIGRYQSGAPSYSYEVKITDYEDKEFLQIVKSMIESRLIISIENLKKEIESI